MRECEEMFKIVQRSRDSRLDLMGGSRLASRQKLHTCQACQKLHTCQACQTLKSHASCCTTGQNSQASQAFSSQLELATQPSHEVKSPEHPIWEKLTFHIHSHLTIYIPLYPRYSESFQRNFERETLEKNKIDSFPIFT